MENDLRMTKDGDLAIISHDIATTDSIEQGIYIRLRWWYGEWKFGPDYGMKYFEDILVKNPDRGLVARDVEEQIMNVDGVVKIDNLSVNIDYKMRRATIRYVVTTESKERLKKEVVIWNSTE